MQILSSTATSQGSIIDQWTQSLGIKECTDATDGNATKWPAYYHKSDAADGERRKQQQ